MKLKFEVLLIVVACLILSMCKNRSNQTSNTALSTKAVVKDTLQAPTDIGDKLPLNVDLN